jgi:hypothetical protein
MKRNSSNYIRANLIKIKIPHDLNISSIVLKMELGKQWHETEKISSKEGDLSKVNIVHNIFSTIVLLF